MNTLLALSGAFGVGSAVAYFFDPERGRRRRSLARGRAKRVVHAVNDAFEITSHDVRNRLVGSAASLRSRVRHESCQDRCLTATRRSWARVSLGLRRMQREPPK